jgi:hypothetical protein
LSFAVKGKDKVNAVKGLARKVLTQEGNVEEKNVE